MALGSSDMQTGIGRLHVAQGVLSHNMHPNSTTMESMRARGTHSKGPSCKRSRILNVLNLYSFHRLNSCIRRFISCIEKPPAYMGVLGSNAGTTCRAAARVRDFK